MFVYNSRAQPSRIRSSKCEVNALVFFKVRTIENTESNREGIEKHDCEWITEIEIQSSFIFSSVVI